MYWVLFCVWHRGQICKEAESCLNLYPCVVKYYLICLSVCGIYENFSLMFSCCTICVLCVSLCAIFCLFLQCVFWVFFLFFNCLYLHTFVFFVLLFLFLCWAFFYFYFLNFFFFLSLFLLKLKCSPFTYVLLVHARQTHHWHCLYFSEQTVSVHKQH